MMFETPSLEPGSGFRGAPEGSLETSMATSTWSSRRRAARMRARLGIGSRAIRVASLLAGLLGTMGLAYWGLTRDLRTGTGDVAAGFRSISVARGTLAETVVATGSMEPAASILIKSEVSGVVRKVLVEKGDRVAAEQPMFELDRDRIEERVGSLQAALEAARASALRDIVGRATLELGQARRDRDRARALFEKGVASALELERLDYKLASAEIELGDARAEAAARAAAVLQATHQLRQAEKDLAQSVIRAPVDGMVTEREMDVGSVVADISAAGGTVLATVADDRTLRLVAEVDENDIALVRTDQSAAVTFDAFPGETFQGTVSKVASAGTTKGNLANFEIEIRIPPDPRVRVGMSADARVRVREHRDALLVPNLAITRSGDGPALRVQDAAAKQGFRLVPIREVYSDGFRTAVEGDVKEGDALVVPAEAAPPGSAG